MNRYFTPGSLIGLVGLVLGTIALLIDFEPVFPLFSSH